MAEAKVTLRYNLEKEQAKINIKGVSPVEEKRPYSLQ